MQHRYAAAQTFEQMLAAAQTSVDLWKGVRAHAKVDDTAVARAESLGGHWHLLVLSEDWCGDAVNVVPVLDELASRAKNFDLRMLQRDLNLDLMDTHLTGKSRSIPVVMAFDEQWVERAWWGPRPSALQEWVLSAETQALEKAERYKGIRRWFAVDKGRTTVSELLTAIEVGVQRAVGASASTSAA
jgi:hypothetical protein